MRDAQLRSPVESRAYAATGSGGSATSTPPGGGFRIGFGSAPQVQPTHPGGTVERDYMRSSIGIAQAPRRNFRCPSPPPRSPMVILAQPGLRLEKPAHPQSGLGHSSRPARKKLRRCSQRPSPTRSIVRPSSRALRLVILSSFRRPMWISALLPIGRTSWNSVS
jgi:hypothetical protein